MSLRKGKVVVSFMEEGFIRISALSVQLENPDGEGCGNGGKRKAQGD